VFQKRRANPNYSYGALFGFGDFFKIKNELVRFGTLGLVCSFLWIEI
jgi:hypothetical protein